MKIVIVGAGEVGLHIATALRGEGHDLVMIERDPERVASLHSTLDVLAVSGDGCDPELLKRHGIAGADLFFAVSNNDAVNLLATLTARHLGARSAVVRVGNPTLGQNPLIRNDEGIVQLNPESLVAEEIFSIMRVPGAHKVRFFADGKLVLMQVRPSPSADIYGKPLKELRGPDNWILAGIHRLEGTVIPRGDTVLRHGDLIYAVGPAETTGDYLASIGVESKPVRRVVIGGAGQVGEELARRLVQKKIEVIVIQRGVGRAFDFAAAVPEALVLRGDCTDPTLLREAGADEAAYFVGATQSDEANLLSALLARDMGARVTVALYNRLEFLNLMHAVRIDIPLSPRLITAGTILRMVHRREIQSLDLVEGGDAEVVEFEVPPRAQVLKKPVAELNFPRTAIVGAVIRGTEHFVPGGAFRFLEGDRALVFTLRDALPRLEKLFRTH